MKSVALSVLFLLTVLSGSKARETGIDLQQLEDYFRSRYKPDFEHQGYFRWEKKDTRWTLVALNLEQGKLQEIVRVTIYENGRFPERLKHFSNTAQKVTYNYENINRDYTSYHLHRFYGYNGWYNDVIGYYEKMPPATDSEFYSLGRAYSTKANAYLSDQYGDGLPAENMQLPWSINSMNKAQVDQYLKTSSAAQSCFRSVMEINPAFETIVGNIRLKYANEVIVPFHGLLTYAAADAQDYTLPDNLYPDSVLHLNRKLLKECPDNAILFGVGDNDFYPILYLQQKENLRRDVYLLNIGLLGLDRYIFRAQFPQMGAKPLLLNLDSGLYSGTTNAYLFNTKEQALMSMKDLREALYLNARSDAGITVQGRALKISPAGNPNKSILVDQPAILFKNTFVFWNLLQHLGNRTILTRYEFPDESLEGFNRHFKAKGSFFQFKW